MSGSKVTVTSNTQRPKRKLVKTIAGQEIELQNEREAKMYIEARDKYLKENQFTVASDLRALDRLILFEVQAYRYQWQLNAGIDYDGHILEPADETSLLRALKETQAQISQIQNDLGLTKAQREKDQHDSVGAYIIKLRQRAKEFGIHREKQLGRALELINQLFSITGSYSRADEAERKKLGFENADQIVDWINEVMRPMYDEVDQYFRDNQQKYWIRDQA